MSEKKIKRIYSEIDHGNMENAYKLIKPMLDDEDPEAQYIYAMHISHKNETAEEFDQRSLKYIKLSAQKLYAPALYDLGITYQFGMRVIQDKRHASTLFKLAAERGHGLAKISYSFDLYLGLNGVHMDKQLAFKLVTECMNDDVEGAKELLYKWKKEDSPQQ